MRIITQFLLYFLLVNLVGCGGGGGGGGGGETPPPTGTTLQKELTSYNTSMDGIVSDMVDMIKVVQNLEMAFDRDDGSPAKTLEINALVDSFNSTTTSFLTNVEKMEQAELGVQDFTQPLAGKRVALLPVVIGAVLVIKGLYSFGQKMKEYSNDMSAARTERDAAATGITNNVPGSEEKYAAAKEDMRDAGAAAVQELATKVTTDLVLSPLNPTSVTTVILKDVAGNTFQEGLKVLSSTEECASGYATSGCTLGVSVTNNTYPAIVPSGKTTLVVGGGSTTRTVIDGEDFPPEATVEITREEIPVTEATPSAIIQNDSGIPVVLTSLSLSKAKLSEDADSITYTVSAAVAGVTAPTTVTVTVENGATGSSTKSITGDSTVFWTITVLDRNATVTVVRKDTGESQTLTLPGKVLNFDGSYTGIATTTYEAPTAICWDSTEVGVTVSGNVLGGDVSGTVSGNVVSGSYYTSDGTLIFSGIINSTTMSGTWHDPAGGCSGTFSLSQH